MSEVRLVYKIYEISEDGLLKIPRYQSGQRVFEIFYDTEAEALTDIIETDYRNGYTILPIAETFYSI